MNQKGIPNQNLFIFLISCMNLLVSKMDTKHCSGVRSTNVASQAFTFQGRGDLLYYSLSNSIPTPQEPYIGQSTTRLPSASSGPEHVEGNSSQAASVCETSHNIIWVFLDTMYPTGYLTWILSIHFFLDYCKKIYLKMNGFS